MKKRKYGFINEQKATDYVFGAGKIPEEVLLPDGNWQEYLPTKEFQAPYGFETYACVTYTILNCIEILIKRRYGEERNYSDRFLAIVSGTKNPGNSPQAVCEFLRKIGVVPEELWPYDKSINSWERWSEKIPPKLYELAKEFNEEWDFRYEQVPSTAESITQALTMSPLLVSVTAWHPRGDKFYRPKGSRDNHATTMFYQRIGDFRRVFDSYDRPHIKDVEWEAMPEFIQRYWIEKKTIVEQKKNIIWQAIMTLLQIIGLMKKEGITELSKPEVPKPEPTMRERLYQVAKKYLGEDVTPKDLIPDELACAESLCTIVRHIDPAFPILPFTGDLLNELKRNPKYKATMDVKEGNIIINATGTGNNKIRGHTGVIIDRGQIASNNSVTGKWDNHWILGDWNAHYRYMGGMRTHIFEPV